MASQAGREGSVILKLEERCVYRGRGVKCGDAENETPQAAASRAPDYGGHRLTRSFWFQLKILGEAPPKLDAEIFMPL